MDFLPILQRDLPNRKCSIEPLGIPDVSSFKNRYRQSYCQIFGVFATKLTHLTLQTALLNPRGTSSSSSFFCVWCSNKNLPALFPYMFKSTHIFHTWDMSPKNKTRGFINCRQWPFVNREKLDPTCNLCCTCCLSHDGLWMYLSFHTQICLSVCVCETMFSCQGSWTSLKHSQPVPQTSIRVGFDPDEYWICNFMILYASHEIMRKHHNTCFHP